MSLLMWIIEATGSHYKMGTDTELSQYPLLLTLESLFALPIMLLTKEIFIKTLLTRGCSIYEGIVKDCN